jgi:hypothetical protein
MFGLAPAQADLQGDSHLTPGCAGHTFSALRLLRPTFREGTIHPAPLRRDGVGRRMESAVD